MTNIHRCKKRPPARDTVLAGGHFFLPVPAILSPEGENLSVSFINGVNIVFRIRLFNSEDRPVPVDVYAIL